MYRYYFDWDKSLKLFPSFWNAVCVAFNSTSMSLNITVNGIWVKSLIESYPIILKNTERTNVTLGGETFTGYPFPVNPLVLVVHSKVVLFKNSTDFFQFF